MAKIVHFPRWAEVLRISELEPKERQGFKVTIRWYLSWCARHSVGCNVASARDFIDWAEAEKQPNAWMLAQWKSAIRWFFVTAKAQARGEAALARIDRGESEAGSGSKSRATSYGGNDTSTRSGQGGASPSGVGQPGSSGKPSAPQASSEQVGRPAISGFSSENDTDAERIVARSEDEASILKVMRRRGMALKTERSYVSAYRNFVRQSGVTCGGAIKGEHLRSYLDLKRNQVAVRCGKGGEGSCGTALGEVGCRH